jgi:hypothetical protein
MPKYCLREGELYRLIAFSQHNRYYDVAGELQIRLKRVPAGKLELSVREEDYVRRTKTESP